MLPYSFLEAKHKNISISLVLERCYSMITVIVIFLIFFLNAIQGLKFFSETDSLLDVVQAGHKAGLARQWLEKCELM